MFDSKVWEIFVHPSEITEIRIVKAVGRLPQTGECVRGATVSGYFDDHECFCRCVKAAMESLFADGFYFTPQVIDPRLLGRAFNRLKVASLTTADTNAIAYRWLPFDLDPVRPAGISSSEPELKEALILRDVIAKHIVKELGFPKPLKAMSGNGAHLLFRLPDLPAIDKNKTMIRDILVGLANRFDTPAMKIDTTVYNPARIWKLYGTKACKGDEIPAGTNREARPHRMSYIEDLGDNL